MGHLFMLAALLLALPAHAVTIDRVRVGDPGDAVDLGSGYGAVAYVYQVSETEVTNARYAEFPNAVADTDTSGLYNATSMSYFDCPAGSEKQTTCGAPGVTPNTANCDWSVGDLTDVGSYTVSASPNGTFDQGGNVWEWSEAQATAPEPIIGSYRSVRGGSFSGYPRYNLVCLCRSVRL